MKSTSLNKVLGGVWGVLKRLYAWLPPRRAAPIARRLKFGFMLFAVGLFLYLFGAWILNLLAAAIIVVGGLVLVILGVVGQATKPKDNFTIFEMYDSYTDDPYDDRNSPYGHDAYGNRLECGQSSKRSY